MASNLRYKHPRSRSYQDIENFDRRYGRYYDFEAAKESCPEGWIIPTHWSWDDLLYTYGGSVVKVKDPDNHLATKKILATGKYHFNFIYAGYGDQDGFFMKDYQGQYWTQTEVDRNTGYMIFDQSDHPEASLYNADKSLLLSVRCILHDESFLDSSPKAF